MGETSDNFAMCKKSAFTLIELLVVIAIIAILSAIIFPVYMRAKVSAYRSSDMSNMNELRTALQLYKTDQDAYPPRLLGFVSLYQSGPNMGNVIPADQLVGALYPERIRSIDIFRPAFVRGTEAVPTTTTQAVWPPSANIGGIDASPLQRFGPADGPVTILPNGGLYAGVGTAANFYTISGYDTALVKTATGTERELRYALFWSGFGLTSGSPVDTPNQLGYQTPPASTLISWDTYFEDVDSNGLPLKGQKAGIALFLGGSAKAYDAWTLYQNAWASTP